MRNHSGASYALGLGIAGAIVGMHVYLFCQPKYQREIEKTFRKAANQLNELATEIGDNWQEMKSDR